ncbi:universal stress protein [Antrihabitans stalactiti]|uniref:Universal stress protein n=1 Tax=Antrihabitans stalactiti TaxID=2584121 RepID=A0A848K9J8_9NOCA|nr:universal stress protein [Antrihabitans stalactiti]NMN93954.1 universal stress protein [Antrihabitans stalactiti]
MNDPEHERSICVGIDGSNAAIHAAQWAATEATARNVPLELVHVIATDNDYGPLPIDIELERPYAREILDAAKSAVTAGNESVKVETEIITGRLHPTLRYLSESAELLVVGSVGVSHIRQLLIGSTAVDLAHNALCPLVIVRAHREGSIPTTGPVVVAVDYSAANDAVFGFAAKEAAIRKSELLAVHAWRLHLGIKSDEYHLSARAQEAQELLDNRISKWQRIFPDVRMDSLAVQANPAHYFEDLSNTAQIVVVGGRTDSSMHRRALGSVANTLVHHSKCPVFVVPGKDNG